jgi:Holliday junction resolvasome RuvABC endonuclease subunit
MASDRATYVGIDPAYLVAGIATVVGGNYTEGQLIQPDPKAEDGDRLADVFWAVVHILNRYKPRLVALEGYSMGSVHKPYSMGEVSGTIKLAVAECGCRLINPAPTQLKLFVAGNGLASKERVRDALLSFGMDVGTSLDISDATGLALIAEAVDLGYSPRKRRCEEEVIRSLTRPAKPKPRERMPFNM